MNTTNKGDVSEYKFILRCLELGIAVLKPIGNNLAYDFVIETSDGFKRVQVKKGRKGKSKETFQFNTRSTSKNFTEVVQKDYIGKVDYFASDYLENIYLMPIEDCVVGTVTLYFGNTPRKDQKLACNYLF